MNSYMARVALFTSACAAILFYNAIANFECCAGEDGFSRNIQRFWLFCALPPLFLALYLVVCRASLVRSLLAAATLVLISVIIYLVVFPAMGDFVVSRDPNAVLRTSIVFSTYVIATALALARIKAALRGQPTPPQ